MATLIILALVVTLCWKAREVAAALDMLRLSSPYPAPAPYEGGSPDRPGHPEIPGGPYAAILSRSPQRDAQTFLKGVAQVYELVVTAFATGNLAPVDYLLGRELAADFADAIAGRRQRGEQLSVTFIGIVGLDIVDGGSDGERLWLDVRIVGQMVSVLRDSLGAVVLGDPLRVVDIPELWTFERQLHSPDPVWQLVATEPKE